MARRKDIISIKDEEDVRLLEGLETKSIEKLDFPSILWEQLRRLGYFRGIGQNKAFCECVDHLKSTLYSKRDGKFKERYKDLNTARDNMIGKLNRNPQGVIIDIVRYEECMFEYYKKLYELLMELMERKSLLGTEFI